LIVDSLIIRDINSKGLSESEIIESTRRSINEAIQKWHIIPTTIESFIFEFIPSYKDTNFKSILDIVKDRPAITST